MKVTREVIYDLLPAYFANEASADTRALVEEYFATDPEFGRMAARFHALLREKPGKGSVAGHEAGQESEAAREREAFDWAKAAAELPQRTRAAALMWGFAAVLSFGIAAMTWSDRFGFRHPGVLIGACFAAAAIAIWIASYYITPDSWWRSMVGLDDVNLESMWIRRRRRIERT